MSELTIDDQISTDLKAWREQLIAEVEVQQQNLEAVTTNIEIAAARLSGVTTLLTDLGIDLEAEDIALEEAAMQPVEAVNT
jgi:hypothetical protein